MKEKEIHLTLEEIDYLLKGTVHWEDIAPRATGPLRKPMNMGAGGKEAANFAGEANFAGDMKGDFFEEDQPFWSGAKVYIILSLMGCLTLGTWAYFVFA